MTRLRMKPSSTTTTTTTEEEAVLKATRRASRKKRRRHKPQEEETISPPRSSRSNDFDFDESSLPPSQAYKQSREQEEDFEREFENKLKEASVLDQGIGYHEQAFYSTGYTSALHKAAGLVESTTIIGGMGMDEEEYAEYLRAGIWRLKNKERLQYLEQQERLNEIRRDKERQELKEREKKNRERKQKFERKRKQEVKQERLNARERYELGWSKLHHQVGGELRFTDFVWPIFPPFALPPISWPTVHDINPTSIQDFLLSSSSSDDDDGVSSEDRKQRLRSAVLNYHPDRFERFVQQIKSNEVNVDGNDKDDDDDGEGAEGGRNRGQGGGGGGGGNGVQERVRELGLRVSQVLNDLLREEKKKK